MNYLLQGILLGLSLSILAGPILFALLQTGIERGFRAGVMVGLGVWISDFIYISGVYFGMVYLQKAVDNPSFFKGMGWLGGIFLVVFGLVSFFKKPSSLAADISKKHNYFQLMMKGFAVNTFNPFTVFFWTSTASATVLAQSLSWQASFLFYAGILLTIVITDSLKIAFAKYLRKFLTLTMVAIIRKAAAILLILFGIILIIRVNNA